MAGEPTPLPENTVLRSNRCIWSRQLKLRETERQGKSNCVNNQCIHHVSVRAYHLQVPHGSPGAWPVHTHTPDRLIPVSLAAAGPLSSLPGHVLTSTMTCNSFTFLPSIISHHCHSYLLMKSIHSGDRKGEGKASARARGTEGPPAQP